MDLIYMNKEREDVGVLHDYRLDLAFGQDENDCELKIPVAEHCCGEGFYLYIENTEYGGVIDSIKSDTAAQEVTYTGRTWHGLLNSKIIAPDTGADYLVLNGEANEVLGFLIQRLDLSELFAASDEDSGLVIAGYKMNRYIPAYDGIRKMLSTVLGKLRFAFRNGKVILSAHPRKKYTQDSELDSDTVDFVACRHYHPANHLICLGRGELAAREVLHLYADAEGNISYNQTYTGLDERCDVYENANAESLEDLERGGIERLKELALADEINASLGEDRNYDVQDLICASDNITGLSTTAQVVKKIVTIERAAVTITYQMGE